MIWNAKNGSVPIGNARMDYVSFGHGKKVMVVIPGLSDGLVTVKGKALILAPPYKRFFEDYTIYMFSRIDPLPKEYSIREMAEDQAKAMQILGLEKVNLAGVSQGGMIAQYLAAFHGELVGKLVIVVSVPGMNDMIRSNIEYWISLAKQGDYDTLTRDMAVKTYTKEYLKKHGLRKKLVNILTRPKNFDRFLTDANAILGFDGRETHDKITCPVLIVGAEEDTTLGAEPSRELHRILQGSELIMYPHYGHGVFDEAPDFYETTRVFIEKEI